MLDQQRDRVAASARRLASHGLVIGTAGNVSERCGDAVAITPTGAALAELTAAQVAVVDYRRYDAGAVVHTHARGQRCSGAPVRDDP